MSAYISLTPQELKRQFDIYDKDGSGKIQLSEMKDLFARHGANLSDGAMQYLWIKYDKDQDGTIDYYEFVEYITGQSYAGPIPQAPSPWTHAHSEEKKATSSNVLAAFPNGFHRGFIDGYLKGYLNGLSQFKPTTATGGVQKNPAAPGPVSGQNMGQSGSNITPQGQQPVSRPQFGQQGQVPQGPGPQNGVQGWPQGPVMSGQQGWPAGGPQPGQPSMVQGPTPQANTDWRHVMGTHIKNVGGQQLNQQPPPGAQTFPQTVGQFANSFGPQQQQPGPHNPLFNQLAQHLYATGTHVKQPVPEPQNPQGQPQPQTNGTAGSYQKIETSALEGSKLTETQPEVPKNLAESTPLTN